LEARGGVWGGEIPFPPEKGSEERSGLSPEKNKLFA